MLRTVILPGPAEQALCPQLTLPACLWHGSWGGLQVRARGFSLFMPNYLALVGAALHCLNAGNIEPEITQPTALSLPGRAWRNLFELVLSVCESLQVLCDKLLMAKQAALRWV